MGTLGGKGLMTVQWVRAAMNASSRSSVAAWAEKVKWETVVVCWR